MKFLSIPLLLFFFSFSFQTFAQETTPIPEATSDSIILLTPTAGPTFRPFVIPTSLPPIKAPTIRKTSVNTLGISNWIKKNKLGFDITQIAFVNWNAGGTSSISGLVKGNFTRVYTRENYKWQNRRKNDIYINLDNKSYNNCWAVSDRFFKRKAYTAWNQFYLLLSGNDFGILNGN